MYTCESYDGLHYILVDENVTSKHTTHSHFYRENNSNTHSFSELNQGDLIHTLTH